MLGATRVRVSFWFLAGLALFTLLDRSFIAPALFCAVALHESAHLGAMLLLGARVREVSLHLYGARIDADLSLLAAGRRAAVYLCAPLLNLLLGAAFWLCDPLSIFGVFNLCIGAFNLLPVAPLDGGNALETAITSTRGARFLRGVSLVFLCLLAAGAAFLCVRTQNFSLLFCVLYLAGTVLTRGL